MPQAALISSVGSSVSKTVFYRARALGPSSLPARAGIASPVDCSGLPATEETRHAVFITRHQDDSERADAAGGDDGQDGHTAPELAPAATG
jgi:hypothetical protein